MNHWYVLKTKLKKEKYVTSQLSAVGYELFFPLIKGLHAQKPLFPNYLFIHADLENPYNHRMIRYTRGVYKILGNEEKPTPVDSIIIETLREQTRNGSLLEQDLLFKEGDAVTVKKGILKDLRGMIKKNLAATGRVRVLFKWLSGTFQA